VIYQLIPFHKSKKKVSEKITNYFIPQTKQHIKQRI
jgi:hypothetical protein